MGTATQTEISVEGKVALKLAGECHEVTIFLRIRKHTAHSCNPTLLNWIKHHAPRGPPDRHTARASPHRDSLRLVAEKLKVNII